jgi:drug/metabolite transporter (DMT)-like permease
MSSDVMEYLKTQWADIHHSRNQEWTILAMIGVSFYLLSQKVELYLKIVAIGLGIATCVVGIFISTKHWAILYCKAKIISDCQEKLGIKIEYFESNIKVQGMIIFLYFLIISILSALLTWLLLNNVHTSVSNKILILAIVGILIIIHGIIAYFRLDKWAWKKRDKIKVNLSPNLLHEQPANSIAESK